MEMVEVNTCELVGPALDWAVAKSENFEVFLERSYPCYRRHLLGEVLVFSPSTDWAQGGPLIEKCGVLLSPPKSLNHYNGGPKAGWSESGYWGTTIFGRERSHRRACFTHETMPLVAAMRAVVQFTLGDTVQVPKELMQ